MMLYCKKKRFYKYTNSKCKVLLKLESTLFPVYTMRRPWCGVVDKIQIF